MSLPKIMGGRRWTRILMLIGLGFLRTAGTVLAAKQLNDLLRVSSGAPWSAWPMVGLAVLGVGFYGVRVLEAGLGEGLGQDYVRRVRLRLVRRLLLGADTGGSHRMGAMMARLVNDLNALKNWVSQGVARGVSALATLVGIVVVSAFYDRYLMGCVIGVSVLSLGFSAMLSQYLRERIRCSRLWRGRMANHLGEVLAQRQTLKAFGRERAELTRVRRRSREIQSSQTWRAVSSAMVRRITDCWHGVLLVLVILHLGFFSGGTVLSASDLGGVLLWLGLLLTCLSDLNASWDYRLGYSEGARRIEQLLKSAGKKRKIRSGDKDAVQAAEEGLVLDQVCLGNGMKEWSAAVAPGQRVVLMGESGSGKTGLLQVIAGLREAAGGEVRWMGHSLSHSPSRRRRKWVQYVGSEIELLRGTVRSNLSWGNRGMEESGLEGWVEAHGLVSDEEVFPEGLNTRLGENGKGLPSLARARICLARAARMRPPVLLIDDPNLSMKSEGREWVLRVLREWNMAVIWVLGDEVPKGIEPDQIWRIENGDLVVKYLKKEIFQAESETVELALI